jgi:hypothetical protein
MNITDIEAGDTLCSTDRRGTGYYRVVKVNKITVDVIAENGNKVRSYPAMFDRKVTYAVAAFDTVHITL